MTKAVARWQSRQPTRLKQALCVAHGTRPAGYIAVGRAARRLRAMSLAASISWLLVGIIALLRVGASRTLCNGSIPSRILAASQGVRPDTAERAWGFPKKLQPDRRLVGECHGLPPAEGLVIAVCHHAFCPGWLGCLCASWGP